MFFFVIISIQLLNNPLRAQTIKNQNIGNIEKYYQNIYLAEKLIMSDNIDSAVYHFKNASYQHRLFSKHAFNACIAATKVNDMKFAVENAELLISRGLSPDVFIFDNSFASLVVTKEWDRMEMKGVKPIYNNRLRSFIINLHIEDQEYRRTGMYEEKRIQVDYKIERIMDSLFLVYGYLSEDIIGIFQNDDQKFDTGWSPFDVIMIHQVKLRPTKHKRFFEESVSNGSMANTVLSMHSTNFDGDSSYLFRCFFFGIADIQSVGEDWFSCGEELEKIVNLNRERIFMPNLNHSIKSAYFRDKKTPYLIGKGPIFFSDMSDEQLEELRVELKESGYKQLDHTEMN